MSRLPWRLAPPAAIAAAVQIAQTPLARNDRWQRQVGERLARATKTLGLEGYHVAGPTPRGSLNTGESASFTLTLPAAATYVFAGVCDDDCPSLHLTLLSGNGYEVDASRTTSNAPIVRVTPRQTMSYRVTVVMASCTMNPCWYGIGVYRR